MFFSENLVLDEEHFLVCTAQSTTGFDIFAEYFPKYVKKKKKKPVKRQPTHVSSCL